MPKIVLFFVLHFSMFGVNAIILFLGCLSYARVGPNINVFEYKFVAEPCDPYGYFFILQGCECTCCDSVYVEKMLLSMSCGTLVEEYVFIDLILQY